MNKKLLLCGVIAASLILTACVKKETPKDDEQEKVETTQPAQSSEAVESTQFEPLNSIDNSEAEVPTQVEVERTETENTTTEVRREVRDVPPQAPSKPEAQKPVAPKAEDKPTSATSNQSNSDAQSEDDAVAAAIAAATPALNN